MAKPVYAFIGNSERAQDIIANFFQVECQYELVRLKDYDLLPSLLPDVSLQQTHGRTDYLKTLIRESLDDSNTYVPLVVCDLKSPAEVNVVTESAPQTRFFRIIDPFEDERRYSEDLDDDDIDAFLSSSGDTVSTEGFPIVFTNQSAVIGVLEQIVRHG